MSTESKQRISSQSILGMQEHIHLTHAAPKGAMSAALPPPGAGPTAELRQTRSLQLTRSVSSLKQAAQSLHGKLSGLFAPCLAAPVHTPQPVRRSIEACTAGAMGMGSLRSLALASTLAETEELSINLPTAGLPPVHEYSMQLLPSRALRQGSQPLTPMTPQPRPHASTEIVIPGQSQPLTPTEPSFAGPGTQRHPGRPDWAAVFAQAEAAAVAAGQARVALLLCGNSNMTDSCRRAACASRRVVFDIHEETFSFC